jgi:crotonobetaine/carnitine-CoA ligase
MYKLMNIRIILWGTRSLLKFFKAEIARGTFWNNFKSLMKTKEIAEDMCWAELLEEKAKKHPEKNFILFEDKNFTYGVMDENANRIGNFFLENGGKAKKGVAIVMNNSPRYLDVFIGSQKIGMYSVPINTSLRGDSLVYILNHSDAEFLVIDEEYLDIFNKVASKIEKIKTVIVNPAGDSIIASPVKNLRKNLK